MKRRTTLSAGQLVLFSSVLALLPAAVFGAYAMYSLVVRDQNTQRQHLLATARALAVGIDHEIDTLRQISSVLASSRLLTGGVENLAAFDDLARDAASAGRYDVVLVNRAGQQLVNTRLEPGRSLPVSRNMHLINQVFASGQPFVSELTTRSSDGTRTIAILTPVIARGETHFVLILTPHLDTVAALFDRVAMQKGWAAAIDDPSGTIVARSIDAVKYVGTKARLRSEHASDIVKFEDLEGRPSHMAYFVSPENALSRRGVGTGGRILRIHQCFTSLLRHHSRARTPRRHRHQSRGRPLRTPADPVPGGNRAQARPGRAAGAQALDHERGQRCGRSLGAGLQHHRRARDLAAQGKPPRPSRSRAKLPTAPRT